MNSQIAETQTKEERRWRAIRYLCFGLLIVSSAVFLIFFGKAINLFGDNFAFSLSLSAVAGILAGTYFYAYTFFKDNLYFCIFLSWFANAVYLIPELSGPKPGEPGYFSYRIGTYALSLISTIFLLLSFFSPGKKKPAQLTSVIMGIVVGILFLASDWYLIRTFLFEGIREFPENEHIKLAWIMLPGSVLSFGALWGVTEILKVRLSSENHGWKKQLLTSTFYTYAILQFVYPFVPFLQTQKTAQVLLVPFLIAQLAKVGNAISMQGVLQAELLAQEERLRSERQFVELGMLASSIKHDVKTPLSTMGMHIDKLKKGFPDNNIITRRLENLEESMDRIEAIVQVVDIFRGDKAFFNRDQFMRKASMLEIAHRAMKSVKNEKPELKQNDAKNKIKVTGRDVWVRAYVPMFEQVIVNVIKNGLEAIDEAGRASGLITINVGTTLIPKSEYSRWVKVEIDDNGCGIPLENMDKLTTIFTTRGDKKPNSGIGLFIGKKILDIHYGVMKFQSTVNVGTKVTLLLPEWNALPEIEQRTVESTSETNDKRSSAEESLDPASSSPGSTGTADEEPQIDTTSFVSTER